MIFIRKIFSVDSEKTKDLTDKKEEISKTLLDFYQNPNNDFGTKTLSLLKKIVWHIMQEDQVTSINWNNYGGGSHYNPETKEIKFDPALVTNEKDLTTIKFVASHEVSHAVITKYSALIKEVLKDSKQIEEFGYSSLCNAIEDPRVNNWGKANYPGAKTWQKKTYEPQFKEENTVLGGGPAYQQIIQQLGYTPKFMIYQSEVIRYWHTSTVDKKGEGSFSKKLDEKVSALLEKTKEHFVEAYELIPHDRKEENIQKTAEESFKIIHEKIWNNGYKELMDEVMHLEDLNQAMQDQDLAQEIWDQLTDEQKKELLDNMQKILDQQLAQGSSKGKAEGAESKEQPEIKEGSSGKINPNELSDELKQKIEEILDKTDNKKQQEIKEKSEQSIGQVEDILNDEYESDLKEDKMPKHTKDSQEKSDERDKEKSKADKDDENTSDDSGLDKDALDKAQQALDEINELSQTDDNLDFLNKYDKTLMEFGSEIDQLVQDLSMILRANEYPKYTSGHDSGQRINLDKAMQYEADPAQYKIFDKRRTPTERDFKFTILLDMSGSMNHYNKKYYAFKALAFLSEAFYRLNLPIEIIGFKIEPFVIKDEKDILDEDMRQKLSSIPENVNWGDGNADGEAIEYAYDRMQSDNREFNFMIVISDGIPEDSTRGENPKDALNSIVDKINLDQIIPTPIGLGLGSGTEHVKDFYKIALPNIQPKDLGKTFADLMRDIVENPFKYSGDEHYSSGFNGRSNVSFINNQGIEKGEDDE